MLSYLSNRHYHTLTQLLPPQLRINQPQKIYYKSNINQQTLKLLQQTKKITHKTLSSHKKVQHNSKNLPNDNHKINGCPICQQQHISVQYHGYRHICIKCRNFIRDSFGHQIKIYLDNNNDIICLGILPKTSQRLKTTYYLTDHTKLEIMNQPVYATYAGQNQLVLILKENYIK